jgi:hypothetical protein
MKGAGAILAVLLASVLQLQGCLGLKGLWVGSCADPGHWCDENAKWSAECYKKCHEDFKGEDKKINSCLFDTCEKKTNSNAEGKWSQGNWVSPNPSPPAEALVEETAAPHAVDYQRYLPFAGLLLVTGALVARFRPRVQQPPLLG